MAARFSKKDALTLFCCFRQAERSVHHAAAGPEQWTRFLAYYDEPKQARIAALLGMLKGAGGPGGNIPLRRALDLNGFLDFFRGVAGILTNRLRVAWSFSAHELAFFDSTLKRLVAILHGRDMPDKKDLIGLRLDCVACQAVIKLKLIGIPELGKAASIEHFDQSEYVRHVTFEEMGIHMPCAARHGENNVTKAASAGEMPR
jgi:hypothetical protein